MAAARAPLVPSTLPTLHVYRQLLREASYLPPALSPYISGYIRRRFHQHKVQDNHQQKRISRAREALRTIRAANYGERRNMTRLVLKAFGRQAVRRRELMGDFVYNQDQAQAVDSKALGALLDRTIDEIDTSETKLKDTKHKDSKKGRMYPFLDNWDRKKLRKLLDSQSSQQKKINGGFIEGQIRSTNELSVVPKKNVWGNVPATRLVRSKMGRWWKRQSSKIMPPLGKGEWDLLKRLSQGAQNQEEAWKIPQRRTPARPLSDETAAELDDTDLDRYASEATAQIENRRLSRTRRYYGTSDPNPYGNTPRGADQRSARWFRRVYQQTWHLTPHMEQNPNTLAYTFTWGKPRATTAPTQRQMIFFEGVDEKGQKPKAPKVEKQ